ncbi:MAG: hypothetical protein KC416_02260 [Myxococcales bacterium]|nr:hypothetical protein [Myxococcales bacterium]
MMKKLGVFVCMMGALALLPGAVSAQDAAPSESKPLVGGNNMSIFGTVGSQSTITGAINLDGGIILALGLGFQFNGNGGATNALGAAGGPSDKVGFLLALNAEYMVYNVFPFAMGPEVTAAFSIAPGDAFSAVAIQPGWAFWYAPWAAPIGVGVNVGLPITLLKGADPIISTVTGGIRFSYIFG